MPDENKFQFVTTEEIVEELKKRTDYMVCAYSQHDEDIGEESVVCCKTGRVWMFEVGLAEILKNDVLNNYNGELENKDNA